MADLETLGDRLRRRRKALGMRSVDLARRTGVSQSYIWLIESARNRKPTERRHVSRDVLVRWAATLGVEHEELEEWLALADYDSTLTRDEVKILNGDGRGRGAALYERPTRFSMDPREVDRDVVRELQDRLQTVVRRASVTNRQDEAMRLLDSYLDWLSYYLAR